MSTGEANYDRINDYGAVRISLASPHDIRSLVLRRSQEAGDHQLPHLPPRKGRPVLRAHLRPGEGLGMRLRQVPRHEVQGHDLRPLRRQGHAQPRPPQAHGPHRAGRPRRPHLVLQGHAQPPGHPAGHEDHRPGKDHLLPGLRRRRSGRHAAQGTAAAHRGGVPQGPREVTAKASRPTWAPRPSRSCSSSSTWSSCPKQLREELHDPRPEGQAVQAEAARPDQAAQDGRSPPRLRPNKPEWMVLECIPVIPPDLRPAGAARFAATSPPAT